MFEQTQRDAEREHTINRVTSRIRNARSVDEVLSIAAQELRLATRASRSVVEILPDDDQPVQHRQWRRSEGMSVSTSARSQPKPATFQRRGLSLSLRLSLLVLSAALVIFAVVAVAHSGSSAQRPDTSGQRRT